MKRSLPLPVRFVLLVMLVVVAPLGFMGYWLAGTAARSGEELLRSRLRQTNARMAAEVASNWITRRSELLTFAEDQIVQGVLAYRVGADSLVQPGALVSEIQPRFDSLTAYVVELTLRDVAGDVVGRFTHAATALPTFGVTLPVRARPGGHPLGSIEARLSGEAVLGSQGASNAAVGAVVAVIDPVDGASLRGLPFDPSVMADARFEWEGGRWVVERRTLLDPRLDVISAAPLAEFAVPFEAAARSGLTILVGVVILATVLAAVLTRRMTHALAQLALAADSVSLGDLSLTVPVGRRDEVGRVAEAFNRMAERLSRTLAELSQREALAAVGSFASELAHEVRNPLTAIKVDLQFVEERLPEGSELRGVQHNAVDEVDRLDRTVAGVLQIARSGQIETELVDVREPLLAALQAVQSIARDGGPAVRADVPDHPLVVPGDRSALHRLFTNLLANAVQAAPRGGTVAVRASANGGDVVVSVADDGPGILPEHLSRVREPFFSTRPDGTGLGLAIADRIAAAHHAQLTIESELGRGTVVTVGFGSIAETYPAEP